MMTTAAALFGTLPITWGYGEGADARQPLGLAVVGGLIISQLLTLYITPVVSLYLEGFVTHSEETVLRDEQVQTSAS
jgi:HAE1 family hydrophobic/amphiphilic exporter-1